MWRAGWVCREPCLDGGRAIKKLEPTRRGATMRPQRSRLQQERASTKHSVTMRNRDPALRCRLKKFETQLAERAVEIAPIRAAALEDSRLIEMSPLRMAPEEH